MRRQNKTKLSIILLLSALIPMVFLISCGGEGSPFSDESDTTESTQLSGCALWCDHWGSLCLESVGSEVTPEAIDNCVKECDGKLQRIDDASCNGLDLTAFEACSEQVFTCEDLVGCFEYVQCDTDLND